MLMDDGQERREVEAWVRNALTPDGEAGARVAVRALATSHASTPASRRRRFAVLAAAALALLAVLVGFQWRRAGLAPAPLAVPILGGGPLVVIESPEGRRWIVGRSPERPGSGSYVIVIPGSKEGR
jgi:hypothetical protein